MKRVIIAVIDSMGIGAMPDCREYGDIPECNTLKNVCRINNGLNLPVMESLGLGNLCELQGVKPVEHPLGITAVLKEESKGKDTTTGHWEIAGLVSEKKFETFPKGFPKELIDEFVQQTNCGGILANIPASGTVIIEQLNDEHHRTKYPIVYTSADSVFQIAVDTDLIPLETLYDWCKTARKILDEKGYFVARVIARPYKIIDGKPTRISADRRDYSMVPPKDTILNTVKKLGASVVGIGKIEDIFAKSGITHAVHTSSNKEGLELTLKAVKNELELNEIAYPDTNITNNDIGIIFTNLVDTDMLYGHRNDYKGYGKALEEIDVYLDKIIKSLKDDDMLIITADHGCDPTVPGTDHTREKVPVLIYKKGIKPYNFGEMTGFKFITAAIAFHLL